FKAIIGLPNVTFTDHPAGERAGFTATYPEAVDETGYSFYGTIVYFTCPEASFDGVRGDLCYLKEARDQGWLDIHCTTSYPCQCGSHNIEGGYHYTTVLEYMTEEACPV
ncbi:hypothetical protein KIPB_013177, partial [Kipferlia bialata]